MTERRCSDCEFWDGPVYNDGNTGFCRRFPPTGDDDHDIGATPWHTTFEDAWCGEFLKRVVHGAWDGVAPTPRFKVGDRVVGDGLSGVVERVLAEPSYTVRTRDGSMEGVPESELRHAEESDHG